MSEFGIIKRTVIDLCLQYGNTELMVDIITSKNQEELDVPLDKIRAIAKEKNPPLPTPDPLFIILNKQYPALTEEEFNKFDIALKSMYDKEAIESNPLYLARTSSTASHRTWNNRITIDRIAPTVKWEEVLVLVALDIKNNNLEP